MKTRITVAICTPLKDDGGLDIAGLEAHINEVQRHGMNGLLVAGTMGLMQLQTEKTYRDLISHSVRAARGRNELMVGVGDASFVRTRDRMQLAEQFAIDGVVVLSPYLVKFSQPELIDYFRTLADASRIPLYMYDLPGLTGTRIELDTVLQLTKHPNIRGIKCSGAWDETRQLMDRVPDTFRVIPAQPHLVDHLIRAGVPDNLDGIFGIAPNWTAAIAETAEAGNWDLSARVQKKLSGLLQLLRHRYNIFDAAELIFSARGISGRLSHAPMRQLTKQQKSDFVDEPLVQELLGTGRCD